MGGTSSGGVYAVTDAPGQPVTGEASGGDYTLYFALFENSSFCASKTAVFKATAV
jgi:hypothetical protein